MSKEQKGRFRLAPRDVRDWQAPLQVDLEDAIASAGGIDQRFAGEKERERQRLHSLRPEIERVAKEAAERERLKATAEQQRRMAREARKPWLERDVSVPSGKYRQEQKEERDRKIAEEISILQAKRRENAKRRNAAPEDNGPTPERAAKLRIDGKHEALEEISPPIKDDETRSLTRTHRVQGVVEFYREQWTYEELEGARFLVRVWHEAVAGQPMVTANYDGTPANAFGPRRGGLAAHSLDANAQVVAIEARIFAELGPRSLSTLRWLWGAVKVARDGAPLNEQMQALGRMLGPFVEDKGRLWGMAFDRLAVISHFAYAHWVRVKGGTAVASSPAEVRARLKAKGLGAAELGKIVDVEIARPRLVKGGGHG